MGRTKKQRTESKAQKKDFDVLVYRYGCKPPFENKEVIREQLRLAHNYTVELNNLERGRRQMRCAIMELHEPFSTARENLLAANAATAEAAAAVKRIRSDSRTLDIPAELQQKMDTCKEIEDAAFREFIAQYHDVFRHVGWLLRPIDARAKELVPVLRAEAVAKGLYWGTYLKVEEAAERSRQSMPDFHNRHLRKRPGAKAKISGADLNLPKRGPFDGQGNLSVQLQKGMTVEKLFGQDRRLRVDAVDPSAWASSSRSERRRLAKTYLQLRIGSDAKRQPVFGKWRMFMHRALPEDAKIKWATITLRRYGTKEEWQCHFTIETRSRRNPVRGLSGKGAVGVDIGWRKMGGQIRAAMWYGEDGEASKEIHLTEAVLERLDHCDEIKSRRDKEFNVARDKLVQWIGSEIPGWMALRCKTLPDWRSCARLKLLLMHWRSHRFEGDTEAFEAVAAWAYHDNHLYDWEANLRTKTLRRRLDGYQSVARKLAETYDELVLEDFDLGLMVMRPQLGEEKGDNARARFNRMRVAIGQFRRCLIAAFVARNKPAWKIPSYNTTKECHITGVVEDFDAAKELRHTTKLGTSWDQDDNAARNLVKRFRQDPSQATPADKKGTKKASQEENLSDQAAE